MKIELNPLVTMELETKWVIWWYKLIHNTGAERKAHPITIEKASAKNTPISLFIFENCCYNDFLKSGSPKFTLHNFKLKYSDEDEMLKT